MAGVVGLQYPPKINYNNYMNIQPRYQIHHNLDENLTTIERCHKTGKIEISLRYCTQCLIDMPLRARHCRLC